jgi:hypothetical protein
MIDCCQIDISIRKCGQFAPVLSLFCPCFARDASGKFGFFVRRRRQRNALYEPLDQRERATDGVQPLRLPPCCLLHPHKVFVEIDLVISVFTKKCGIYPWPSQWMAQMWNLPLAANLQFQSACIRHVCFCGARSLAIDDSFGVAG